MSPHLSVAEDNCKQVAMTCAWSNWSHVKLWFDFSFLNFGHIVGDSEPGSSDVWAHEMHEEFTWNPQLGSPVTNLNGSKEMPFHSYAQIRVCLICKIACASIMDVV